MGKEIECFACKARPEIGSKITFYNFPRNVHFRKEWILATKRTDYTTTKSAKMCSQHFKPEDFVCNFGVYSIRKGHIPSIFRKCNGKPRARSRSKTVSIKTCEVILNNIKKKDFTKKKSDNQINNTKVVIKNEPLDIDDSFTHEYSENIDVNVKVEAEDSRIIYGGYPMEFDNATCSIKIKKEKDLNVEDANEKEQIQQQRLVVKKHTPMVYETYVERPSLESLKNIWKVGQGTLLTQQEMIKDLQKQKKQLSEKLQSLEDLVKQYKNRRKACIENFISSI